MLPIPQREHPMRRWRIAALVAAAIVLSYMDRLTLPWTLTQIQRDYPFSDQIKAAFDSAFLISYGLMYVGGGRLLDRLGTRRGFLIVMVFWSLACASQGLAGNYGVAPISGMAFALIMLIVSRFLLGMGEDGHTASLFPGQHLYDIDTGNKICTNVHHPNTGQERITLTLPVLNNAREVIFLVTGRKKSRILADILNENKSAETFPAFYIQPAEGKLYWLLDREASLYL